MKRLSIIMLIAVAACALSCSDNNAKYVITGANVPGDGNTIFLFDRISELPIDSAVVKDGTFKMSGKAEKNAYLSVSFKDANWYFPLFNDGTPIKIDYADSVMTGSELNTKLSECDRNINDQYNEFYNFIQDYLSLPKDEQKAGEEEFIRQYEEHQNKYTDYILNKIDENKDNLIPVAFIQNIPLLAGFEKFDEILSSGAPFTQHPYVQDLKRKLAEDSSKEKETESIKNAVIGKKFIDFEEPDQNGKMHKLSEFAGQGKWVLVDFWASWCGPCKAEMPNVAEAYKKYHDKGFEVVGVSYDDNKEKWVKAIADWNMPWIHLSDLSGWDNPASALYGIDAIPDNLLIDPEGTVVARGLRGEKLQAKLAEIFK
jgi:thiol-disulfide isomerase/thioredoxin